MFGTVLFLAALSLFASTADAGVKGALKKTSVIVKKGVGAVKKGVGKVNSKVRPHRISSSAKLAINRGRSGRKWYGAKEYFSLAQNVEKAIRDRKNAKKTIYRTVTLWMDALNEEFADNNPLLQEELEKIRQGIADRWSDLGLSKSRKKPGFLKRRKGSKWQASKAEVYYTDTGYLSALRNIKENLILEMVGRKSRTLISGFLGILKQDKAKWNEEIKKFLKETMLDEARNSGLKVKSFAGLAIIIQQYMSAMNQDERLELAKWLSSVGNNGSIAKDIKRLKGRKKVEISSGTSDYKVVYEFLEDARLIVTFLVVFSEAIALVEEWNLQQGAQDQDENAAKISLQELQFLLQWYGWNNEDLFRNIDGDSIPKVGNEQFNKELFLLELLLKLRDMANELLGGEPKPANSGELKGDSDIFDFINTFLTVNSDGQVEAKAGDAKSMFGEEADCEAENAGKIASTLQNALKEDGGNKLIKEKIVGEIRNFNHLSNEKLEKKIQRLSKVKVEVQEAGGSEGTKKYKLTMQVGGTPDVDLDPTVLFVMVCDLIYEIVKYFGYNKEDLAPYLPRVVRFTQTNFILLPGTAVYDVTKKISDSNYVQSFFGGDNTQYNFLKNVVERYGVNRISEFREELDALARKLNVNSMQDSNQRGEPTLWRLFVLQHLHDILGKLSSAAGGLNLSSDVKTKAEEAKTSVETLSAKWKEDTKWEDLEGRLEDVKKKLGEVAEKIIKAGVNELKFDNDTNVGKSLEYLGAVLRLVELVDIVELRFPRTGESVAGKFTTARNTLVQKLAERRAFSSAEKQTAFKSVFYYDLGSRQFLQTVESNTRKLTYSGQAIADGGVMMPGLSLVYEKVTGSLLGTKVGTQLRDLGTTYITILSDSLRFVSELSQITMKSKVVGNKIADDVLVNVKAAIARSVFYRYILQALFAENMKSEVDKIKNEEPWLQTLIRVNQVFALPNTFSVFVLLSELSRNYLVSGISGRTTKTLVKMLSTSSGVKYKLWIPEFNAPGGSLPNGFPVGTVKQMYDFVMWLTKQSAGQTVTDDDIAQSLIMTSLGLAVPRYKNSSTLRNIDRTQIMSVLTIMAATARSLYSRLYPNVDPGTVVEGVGGVISVTGTITETGLEQDLVLPLLKEILILACGIATRYPKTATVLLATGAMFRHFYISYLKSRLGKKRFADLFSGISSWYRKKTLLRDLFHPSLIEKLGNMVVLLGPAAVLAMSLYAVITAVGDMAPSAELLGDQSTLGAISGFFTIGVSEAKGVAKTGPRMRRRFMSTVYTLSRFSMVLWSTLVYADANAHIAHQTLGFTQNAARAARHLAAYGRYATYSQFAPFGRLATQMVIPLQQYIINSFANTAGLIFSTVLGTAAFSAISIGTGWLAFFAAKKAMRALFGEAASRMIDFSKSFVSKLPALRDSTMAFATKHGYILPPTTMSEVTSSVLVMLLKALRFIAVSAKTFGSGWLMTYDIFGRWRKDPVFRLERRFSEITVPVI